MTEIEKLVVQAAEALEHLEAESVKDAEVRVRGFFPEPLWDALFAAAERIKKGEREPEEATSTVEQRLEALEKRLTVNGLTDSDDFQRAVRHIISDEFLDEQVRDVMTDYMAEDNGWKDYLRDLVSKAVNEIDLDSFVDTYLRDRGVERYMDPEALRHEIEAVLSEVLAGAAALAKPASKRFGARKIGGGS